MPSQMPEITSLAHSIPAINVSLIQFHAVSIALFRLSNTFCPVSVLVKNHVRAPTTVLMIATTGLIFVIRPKKIFPNLPTQGTTAPNALLRPPPTLLRPPRDLARIPPAGAALPAAAPNPLRAVTMLPLPPTDRTALAVPKPLLSAPIVPVNALTGPESTFSTLNPANALTRAVTRPGFFSIVVASFSIAGTSTASRTGTSASRIRSRDSHVAADTLATAAPRDVAIRPNDGASISAISLIWPNTSPTRSPQSMNTSRISRI